MATTDILRKNLERHPEHFRDGLESANPWELERALQSLQRNLREDPGSIMVAYAAGQLTHALQQYA